MALILFMPKVKYPDCKLATVLNDQLRTSSACTASVVIRNKTAGPCKQNGKHMLFIHKIFIHKVFIHPSAPRYRVRRGVSPHHCRSRTVGVPQTGKPESSISLARAIGVTPRPAPSR
jgi:hypothetical protein